MSHTDSNFKADHLVNISANDVLVGMYVSDIDCAWASTPFSIGGFHVRSVDDIETLRKYCKRVVIDVRRGAEPPRRNQSKLTILSRARSRVPAMARLTVKREAYPISRSIVSQIDGAARAYQVLCGLMDGFVHACRQGERFALEDFDDPIHAVTDAVLANPQTLLWILFTESRPKSRYAYCVRAAVWAAVLARQFGLPREEIELLFLGTILADTGLHLLPERLVHKTGFFRKKEYLAYRKHVDFGLELLRQYPQVDESVLRIVRCHHERHDGLGFPKGLRGDQIPVVARFAIFGQCFERLLRTANPHKSRSPAKAIARLYKQRQLKFPEQFIVEFIHVLGLHPIGTLVELTTGELALVLGQTENDRLHPKVAILSNSRQQILARPRVVELKDRTDSLGIAGSADPAALNIDLSVYTLQFFRRRFSIRGLVGSRAG